MWGLQRNRVHSLLCAREIATALRLGKDLDEGLHTTLRLLPALLNQIDLSVLNHREALLVIELLRDFHPEALSRHEIATPLCELLKSGDRHVDCWHVAADTLAEKIEQMNEAQILGMYCMGLCYQHHPPESEAASMLFLRYWLSSPTQRSRDGLSHDYWQLKP